MTTHLLAPQNRALLDAFLRSRPFPLLAFDYDGTLASIVNDRHQARMEPRTRNLLTAVSRKHPTVIISGRAREDMLQRVAGVPLAEVFGNHGLEPGSSASAFEGLVQMWERRLRPALANIEGAELENKRLTISVHFRRSPAPERAEQEIMKALLELGDAATVVPGDVVVNIIPRGARMKSGALRAVMHSLGAERAMFVGDDWTDEEVFRNAEPARVLTVRVGRLAQSAAMFHLDEQREIDDLLSLLLRAGSRAAANA
jgi:trehalose 6-phosphate phosphatase